MKKLPWPWRASSILFYVFRLGYTLQRQTRTASCCTRFKSCRDPAANSWNTEPYKITKAYTLVFTSIQQCPDFKSGMDQSFIYLSACYFEVTKVTEVRVSSRKFKHGWVSDAADSGSRCIFAKLFVECPCRWLIYKFGIDISIYEAALNCVQSNLH